MTLLRRESGVATAAAASWLCGLRYGLVDGLIDSLVRGY